MYCIVGNSQNVHIFYKFYANLKKIMPNVSCVLCEEMVHMCLWAESHTFTKKIIQ